MTEKAAQVSVTLKLFATFRRYWPSDSQSDARTLGVRPGTRVGDVLAGFGVPTDDSAVILINGRTGTPEQVLEDGDIVAVFPSMAGG